MSAELADLERKIGYQFGSPDLLRRALTHRSWSAEQNTGGPERADNEQLEFLGDSILGFVVSLSLFHRYPQSREGDLSKWKSHFVSTSHLYQRALTLDLGAYLILGRGEERSGGRLRRTLLANAMEAVIAAIHLDGGAQAAQQFIQRTIMEGDIDSIATSRAIDQKNALQDLLKSLGLPAPEYVTVEIEGPDHARIFTAELRVGESYRVRASASSKKRASQKAAEILLAQLELGARSGPEHDRCSDDG